MHYKIALFSLGIFSLVTCQSRSAKIKHTAKSSAETSVTKGGEISKSGKIFYLSEGENIFLNDEQMNVTFKGVSEDSRCPQGTNCIWQGAATAQIELMGTYTRPVTLSLNTLDDTAKGFAKSKKFNGYAVTLETLTPYPSNSESGRNLKGKYRIGLRIGKDSLPTARASATTR